MLGGKALSEQSLAPGPSVQQCPEKEQQLLVSARQAEPLTCFFSFLSVLLSVDNWERKWKEKKNKTQIEVGQMLKSFLHYSG